MEPLCRTKAYISESRAMAVVSHGEPLVREDCGTGKYSAFETWMYDMAELFDDGGVLQAVTCAGIVIAILLLLGGQA